MEHSIARKRQGCKSRRKHSRDRHLIEGCTNHKHEATGAHTHTQAPNHRNQNAEAHNHTNARTHTHTIECKSLPGRRQVTQSRLKRSGVCNMNHSMEASHVMLRCDVGALHARESVAAQELEVSERSLCRWLLGARKRHP